MVIVEENGDRQDVSNADSQGDNGRAEGKASGLWRPVLVLLVVVAITAALRSHSCLTAPVRLDPFLMSHSLALA